ncbi:MAG: hypothetical protein M1405_00795 [Patescibacteria group bacterium]|nr:hypothetical protein [Patescibacteria group bacterium]
MNERRGIELLLRKGREHALAQPVAIVHTKIRPIVARTRIIVPEPFTYAEILAEQETNPGLSVTDLAMLRIGRELPPENRGFYAQMVREFVMPS